MSRAANYHAFVEPHRRACQQLKLDLEFFLRDLGSVDVYEISSRVKDYDSAARKSSSLGIPIDDLDDLAGIRVIVGTRNEFPLLERFFSRQEYGNDLKILKRSDLRKSDGYNALHLVTELKSHYSRSVYPGRVEVQLHTVFSHAFNFLSRSWRYKQPLSFPADWEAEFVALSKQLAKLEMTAAELQRSVVENATHVAESALTPHALGLLIEQEFGEKPASNELVDECRLYSNLGYRTTGQIKALFRNSDIAEMYDLAQSRDNLFTRFMLGMGKHGFWHFYGTRMSVPGTRGLFEALVLAEMDGDRETTGT